MFKAKTYNDLRNTLSVANGVFAAVWLGMFYESSLTLAHKLALQKMLGVVRLDPFFAPIVTVSVSAIAWGFVTTYLLRLHDRFYEPHLVSWRAGYESDYILRSLSAGYGQPISEQFFERAFKDEAARTRFMQRLFYKFIGDSTTPHEAFLERFYTTIRNYWLLVLAETYCLAFLVFAAFYCYLAGQSDPPYKAWAAASLGAILLRIWSNRYLLKVRPITAEQVNAVLQDHLEEFRKAFGAILSEYKF